MEVGSKFIGMVNKNTKLFCKDKIENLTKYWPGDYYPVLRSKTVVPGGWSLISIGYKYNMRNVLYFIVTENTGSTQACITCLSNYPDHFTNFAILPAAFPLSYLSSLEQLMRLTSTTNQCSLIWRCVSSGLLIVVGYGYLQKFLWELILLIYGNCFVVGLRETTMKN